MSETSREFPIRAAPYQHQRKAAAFALERLESGGGAALLMEMGTGKTLTIIAFGGERMSRGRPMLTVRMDKQTIDNLKELAAKKDTSVAELVREVLEKWLERQS